MSEILVVEFLVFNVTELNSTSPVVLSVLSEMSTEWLYTNHDLVTQDPLMII